MNGMIQTLTMIFVLSAGTVGFLITKGVTFFDSVEESGIYGEWVEQGVAPYAADRFEIRKDGIYMNGRQTTNRFDFSGTKLSYSFGNTTHYFSVVDENRMMREEPHHYSTAFVKNTR